MKEKGKKKNFQFLDDRQVLDTGTLNAATTAINIKSVKRLYIYGKKKTGNIAGATVKLQCSPDGITWNPTSDDLVFTDETAKDINDIPLSCKFVRLKVTVKSTVGSTADVIVQGK